MQTYRAYPLNAEGHFIGATVFEAASDVEALHIVSQLREDADFEIWCGVRLVGKLQQSIGGLKLMPRPDRANFD